MCRLGKRKSGSGWCNVLGVLVLHILYKRVLGFYGVSWVLWVKVGFGWLWSMCRLLLCRWHRRTRFVGVWFVWFLSMWRIFRLPLQPPLPVSSHWLFALSLISICVSRGIEVPWWYLCFSQFLHWLVRPWWLL